MTDQEIAWLALKVLGVLATLAGFAFGVFRAVSSVMSSKADVAQVERHKKANDEWFERHHKAILDLYAKRDDTLEKLDAHSKRDEEMHNTVLSRLHAMHVDLLEKIGR